MSWHISLTRFASAHIVKKQDAVNSCGIACILMVNFKIKKGLMFAGLSAGASVSAVPVPGASFVGGTLSKAAVDMAVKTEPTVYKIYSDVVGTVYDGTSYTNGQSHPEVLKRLGLGNWECFWAGTEGISAAIKAQAKAGVPCIVHVKWKAGGAHFVCVDDVYSPFGSPYACVNDPADGEVVVTELGGGPVGYLDNKGTFSGWIVRRVSSP
ncbi:hypothetical protein [Roseococcus sp.]|uniref:hypothetical protein n=1 Tax=Roseococcus sp. TaxID=2109646 RepID=UPI003BAAE185